MKSVLRMVRGVVFLFSLTLVLMSCGCGLFSNQIPFAASGPIYEHSVTPLLTASNEEYSRVYTFNADGSATLKATNFHYPVEGLPEPVVEFEVTDTQLDALKQTLVDMKFLRLPEYIDTNTMDGVAYSYEVFMTNGSHCVSVENPDMKSLIHLNELVYEMAGDAPDRLQEAVREYQDPENAPKVPRLEQEVFSYKRHDPYNHEAGKPLYSPVIVMDENGYGYAYAENIQEKDYSVLAPYVEFQLSEQQLAELKKALENADVYHKEQVGEFKPLQPQKNYVFYVKDSGNEVFGHFLHIYDDNLKEDDPELYDFIQYTEEDLFKDTLAKLDQEMAAYFDKSANKNDK